MGLKKLAVTVAAIAIVAGGSGTNTIYAMRSQEKPITDASYQIITPLWINVSDVLPDISAVGNTLYPEVYIKAKSSSGSISGTMYLEKYSSGRWTSVASWNLKGTGNVSLSKSYVGTSGVNYRTRVVVTVDGETVTATSGSCEI